MRKFRPFTYANVASTLALFMALSGTSYALIITSKQIKNESITSTDIKDNAITTTELALDSVTSTDIKDSTIRLRDLNSEVKNKHQETAFTQRRVTSVPLPAGEMANVAYMPLPSGKFLSVASIQLEGGLGDPNAQYHPPYSVHCTMTDAGTNESVTRSVELQSEFVDHRELTLVLAHNSVGEAVVIDCIRPHQVALSTSTRVTGSDLNVISLDSLTTR